MRVHADALAGDIACVWRDGWLIECNVNHEGILAFLSVAGVCAQKRRGKGDNLMQWHLRAWVRRNEAHECERGEFWWVWDCFG